jgi:rRNA maturation endonuclease Nob1
VIAGRAFGIDGGVNAMSWQCVRCGELIDEPFDACWSCGTSRSGVRDRAFRRG